MGFLLLFFCGVLGGILGGMGMGGGTLLIPLLTVACGVPQRFSQGVNLIAFLPMSALALSIHAKNGLLKKQGLAAVVLPAAALSALGSLLANLLPAVLLKKLFGVFLIVLALRGGAERIKNAKPLYKKSGTG